MEYKITEDIKEMEILGRQIAEENPRRYPPRMIIDYWNTFREFIPDEKVLASLIYCGIYCQQIYGTSIMEYGIYGFESKSHAQKTDYVTWFNRFIYMAFLNKKRDIHLLDNKYEAYTLLKQYYKREAMLLTDENDFEAFCDFTSRHKSIFVKPVNLELAEGAHRIDIDSSDLRETFNSLLSDAAKMNSDNITREIDHRLILEELIVPSEAISRFNRNDMSLLRVTTVMVKGKVHFFYPCFRMMCGDGSEHSGEMYSIDALVDADSGELITDGISGFGKMERHPVSGILIKGQTMPDWIELRTMLDNAARLLPTIRYIGWDVTHTDKGWCIIEGNTDGEFFSQMCVGHGIRGEFEDLIGFHVPFGFMLENVEQCVENIRNDRYEK